MSEKDRTSSHQKIRISNNKIEPFCTRVKPIFKDETFLYSPKSLK